MSIELLTTTTDKAVMLLPLAMQFPGSQGWPGLFAKMKINDKDAYWDGPIKTPNPPPSQALNELRAELYEIFQAEQNEPVEMPQISVDGAAKEIEKGEKVVVKAKAKAKGAKEATTSNTRQVKLTLTLPAPLKRKQETFGSDYGGALRGQKRSKMECIEDEKKGKPFASPKSLAKYPSREEALPRLPSRKSCYSTTISPLIIILEVQQEFTTMPSNASITQVPRQSAQRAHSNEKIVVCASFIYFHAFKLTPL